MLLSSDMFTSVAELLFIIIALYLAPFDLNQGVRRMRFRDRSAFPIVGNFLKTVHGLRSLWFAITCFPRARSINRCCKSSTAKNDAAKPVRGDALRATRGFSA